MKATCPLCAGPCQVIGHATLNHAEAEQNRALQVTAFVCSSKCLNNGEHKWDGPVVRLERGGSSSCSICGKLAIDVSMWH